MTWTAPTEGVYEAGYYRVNRTSRGEYTAWFTSPKAYRLIGNAVYLTEAKELCRLDSHK